MRFLTAGESHGKGLTAILEGFPANVHIDRDFINRELSRRQRGYGRGERMKIECDRLEILSGIRNGFTTGAPIAMFIENRDWTNWENYMAPFDTKDMETKLLTKPRPGHGDLPGALKYNQKDIRNVLERASARETAIRTAVGAFAMLLLKELNIWVHAHVVEIGGVKSKVDIALWEDYKSILEGSQLFCLDKGAEVQMLQKIDQAKACGDSLGGVFEVLVTGVPVGFGSHVHWDRKLDGLLAQSLMSIQGIKSVEIGAGIESGRSTGSALHDPISYDVQRGYHRSGNNAGGIEGGISNGESIILRCAMKPIPTLVSPLMTVDMESKETASAAVERSDVCAVPAASVVGKAAAAWTIAREALHKFRGDSLEELLEGYRDYMRYLSSR